MNVLKDSLKRSRLINQSDKRMRINKKTGIFFLFLMLSCGQSYAQIGMYDEAVSVPIIDLVDDQMSSTYLNVMASTYARRKQNFNFYRDRMFDALEKNENSAAITYAQYALNTSMYSADVYGGLAIANERLGNLKESLKAYKKAYELGWYEAKVAIARVKQAIKQNKKH